MFRYSLVCLLALCATGTSFAGTWADGLFEELSRDFGSVPRGPTLKHPYRIVNNTGAPVHIAGVRVSCGCVSASALKNDLGPGEETAILANMDTRRFSGVKTVTIYVTFDQPRYQEVRLWIQANARDDVSVSPDTIAMGQVKRGTEPSSAVAVTFLGNGLSQITEMKSDSNYILPTLKEVRRAANEVSYELTARLRSDTPVGKWYTDVWLSTNNAAMPRVRVPLTVEIESALSVSPEAVLLGQVKAGSEAERRVIIRGVKPFKITEVKGTDAQLSVRDSSAESKAVHVLTVKLKAARPGEWTRTLRVLTDLKEENEIEFLTRVQVVP
jgi:uncharacterized protein DUF1573